MPGSNYKAWRIRSAINKRKQIKIYKSMNEEDIKKRAELVRNIQNYDYKIKVLDEMVRKCQLYPHARLQFSCYGEFVGLEKDESIRVLSETLQRIIDDRAIAVSQLEHLK